MPSGDNAMPKRAIVLGGGGPAAGLHIGALKYFEEHGITFDVWALSCIGAWVGIVHNQCETPSAEKTYKFFREHVFRDDASYAHFPINAVFGPDWVGNTDALLKFLSSPASYPSLTETLQSIRQAFSFVSPETWTRGDFNHWMLNSVLAVNPLSRFLTSIMYLSEIDGMSKIYYPNSTLMNSIDITGLFQERKPYLYHNAWNLEKQNLELFANKDPPSGRRYQPISRESLCACSALPFVESPVKVSGELYREGALIDTVNFQNLLEDHFDDLNEIWISRIVDARQVHKPNNLHDALANLCQLFAATVGEDDIQLFYYHLREGIEINGQRKRWNGTVVELQVDPYVNFTWTVSNLDCGRERGYNAAKKAHEEYKTAFEDHRIKSVENQEAAVRFINKTKAKENRSPRMLGAGVLRGN
jgi:predicted acylesterase/phospholipase RssA